MSRLTEQEREALRLGAEAAAPILERLRTERADIDAKIAKFQAIVDVHEEAVARRPRREVGQPGGKRGEVVIQIDAVLTGGGDYTEPDLRSEVNKRFGTDYSRATIYSALRRGLKKKKYELKERKWRMRQSIG